MSIFYDIDRTNIEPADHLVGRFDYLNASARPEAAHVRALLEEMFARYPEPHQANLVLRLRSRNDIDHTSAAFELILHELLIRQKCDVVAIEPDVPNSSHKPDFLVKAPNGYKFYLEATLATGDLGANPGADRRMRDALHAIDGVDSPDFFLCLHTHGMPASQVSTKRLRREVQLFVNGLDHEMVVTAFEASLPPPSYNFEHDGLCILVEAVPKHFRDTGGRAIGMQFFPGGVIEPHLPIKTAINGKAKRYGKLDLPYIIAVNALDLYSDAESATDALFGTEFFAVREDGQVKILRNFDGVWQGAGGPVYRRVSAVLSTERLSASSLGQCSTRLIVNPWAAQPIPDYPLGVDVLQVENERLVKTSGLTLREILGLPEGWPE